MPTNTNIASVSSSATAVPFLTNEKIIFKVRPNFLIPFSFILFIWVIGGVFFWAMINFSFLEQLKQVKIISLTTIIIIYFLVFGFVGLAIFLSWLNTQYILTNKRVEWHFGIIAHRTISIALEKIENISVLVGILGVIFNYGNIKIEPAGLVTAINFAGIANVESHKEQIEAAMG